MSQAEHLAHDRATVQGAPSGHFSDVLAEHTAVTFTSAQTTPKVRASRDVRDLSSRVSRSQADYESAFHRFKPDKHLKFLQHLGTVTVKLELADRVVEVEATPLQASIAELFEHQDVWTIPDLGLKLGVDDEEIIRNALAWWATQGVVKMQGDTWILLERADGNAVENAPGEAHLIGAASETDDDLTVVVEEDGVIDRLDEDKAEQIQAYWPVSVFDRYHRT